MPIVAGVQHTWQSILPVAVGSVTCSLTTVNALTCTERLLRERQRAAAAGLAMRWPASCMMTVLRCMLLAM